MPTRTEERVGMGPFLIEGRVSSRACSPYSPMLAKYSSA